MRARAKSTIPIFQALLFPLFVFPSPPHATAPRKSSLGIPWASPGGALWNTGGLWCRTWRARRGEICGVGLGEMWSRAKKPAREFLEGVITYSTLLVPLFFLFLSFLCAYTYTVYTLRPAHRQLGSRPFCMGYNEDLAWTRLLKGANVPMPWMVLITSARFHLASMI